MWSDAARAKAVATKKRQARARKLAERMSKPKRRKVERPTKKATPKNYTGKYVKTAAWYADRLKRGMKVETSGLAQLVVPSNVVTTSLAPTSPETPTFRACGALRTMIMARLNGMSLVQLATVLEGLD